ncbi:MAG: thiosulfate oxidation carrier protein SoxY [Gammaproteobacteria bacterium]
MRRRTFLIRAFAGSAVTLAVGAGLCKPGTTRASSQPRAAFQATDEREVLREIFGSESAVPSDAITLEMPLQTMHGKGVPVTVRCAMDDVGLIAVVTRNNQQPLNTFVHLQGADGYYTARIRLERTSPVTAYVRAGNTVYSASALVKVSHGGYGTHLE